MAESAVMEEAKQLIGSETGPGKPIVIERTAIEKYVEPYCDENPIYYDEAYARETWYGGLATPPFFLDTNLKSGVERDFDNIPLKVKRRLRAEDEIEYFCPIRVGDTITANTRLLDIVEKKGKSGRMVFVYTETKYTNQFGIIVMVCRTTIIKR